MNTTHALPRSTPEAQGVPSSAILDFVNQAEQTIDALHSFMLVRHGHVVAEGWWSPYVAEHPHVLFSLSKSFTSTAVGLAVAEGRLTVDDAVISFFPDELPADISPNLAAMRVRHLLSMSTGNEDDTTGPMTQSADGNWVRGFLAQPVQRTPGTHFVYNSGATYMLSAIVQKFTGQPLLDYLQPRLFAPLGIENPTWESCPRGINVGGWGLKIRTEEIARFGQLYLQKGEWHGAQIIPAAWVEAATAYQVANSREQNVDWAQGYGYQFWRSQHGAYRGDGAFGQFCVVMNEQDTVLAITSGVANMQAVLDLVWGRLLPALGTEPLPADTATQIALRQRLATLELPTVQGEQTSPLAAQVSGKRYQFPTNESKIAALQLDFGAETTTLTIEDDQGSHSVLCGNSTWQIGSTTLDRRASLLATPHRHQIQSPIAASGAWTASDTYVIKLYFYETPFCRTFTCRFADTKLVLDSKVNVAFGPTDHPQVTGERVE